MYCLYFRLAAVRERQVAGVAPDKLGLAEELHGSHTRRPLRGARRERGTHSEVAGQFPRPARVRSGTEMRRRPEGRHLQTEAAFAQLGPFHSRHESQS